MLQADSKRVLKDIAFLGAQSGFIAQARDIFSALGEEDEACALGMALTHIGVGEYEAAHEKLQKLLEANSENWDAAAFKCMAYVLEEKHNDAAELGNKVLAHAPESSAATMVKEVAAASSLSLNS
ncbi:tetratricopeptide repeat protein [Halodesulfovibrio spirochaetisodalis]|uniref:Tetratricopeptide repeat protein n=1 Tax=Halodesulfovibrio spirochaetisodalis TaxID=1560234 RepID=A0A1B7X9C5_9BACT|nr:hypothetical protein [Halodesulfovibrio spirochaetisodalis]OBQ45947.1 hypothetical protein SP90_15125 [Halodesulfovibrio spirochaetisodalis]